MEVDEGDLMILLGKAMICALLGNAGPSRTRVLGLVAKDERSQYANGGALYDLLQSMYSERLIDIKVGAKRWLLVCAHQVEIV